jgi:hypothetical protein
VAFLLEAHRQTGQTKLGPDPTPYTQRRTVPTAQRADQLGVGTGHRPCVCVCCCYKDGTTLSGPDTISYFPFPFLAAVLAIDPFCTSSRTHVSFSASLLICRMARKAENSHTRPTLLMAWPSARATDDHGPSWFTNVGVTSRGLYLDSGCFTGPIDGPLLAVKQINSC